MAFELSAPSVTISSRVRKRRGVRRPLSLRRCATGSLSPLPQTFFPSWEKQTRPKQCLRTEEIPDASYSHLSPIPIHFTLEGFQGIIHTRRMLEFPIEARAERRHPPYFTS